MIDGDKDVFVTPNVQQHLIPRHDYYDSPELKDDQMLIRS